jgi:multiple antibiotic resistance protein
MDFSLFWETFLPFFIAFDPVGLLPMYLSLTHRMEEGELRRVSAVAVVLALGICVGFGLFGNFLLAKLGISVADFQIAGGLLLIAISLYDSQHTDKRRRRPESSVQIAVVPIAMPLLVGPAALTTTLLSVKASGIPLTLLCIALNLAVVYIFLYYSKLVVKVIGKSGAMGVGKFFSILLCAIGVMFIRKGIVAVWPTF